MKTFQHYLILLLSIIMPAWLLAQPQLVGPLRDHGPQEGGSIFRINLPGTTPGIIHQFNNLNPHLPVGGVCFGDEDWLYGTLNYNGTNNDGAAYRIRRDGTGYVKLFDFGIGSIARSTPYYHTDGKIYYNAENRFKVFDPATMGVTEIDPQGLIFNRNLLIDSDDYIYFVNFGDRIVKMRTDGSGWEQLHAFASATEGTSGDIGLTEIPGGKLFGLQKQGGTNGGGTLYSINKDGTGFVVHHTFDDATGKYPEARLVYFDGKLFGTTTQGGLLDMGVLFAIDQDGSNYRVLRHFESTSGPTANPSGNIQITADGRVYGCYSQFHQNTSFITNRLWKVDTSGENIEQFFSVFQRDHGHYNRDILLTNDTIFLTTTEQGRHEGGVLNMVDTLGNGATALHHFGASANGFFPVGGLIKGSDGRLYGSTRIGGATGNGIVYSINANGGGFLKLHEFTDAEGYELHGKLLEGSDGKIYGACEFGGPTNTGCLFRMDKNGANFQIIYNFNDLNLGHWPAGSLVESGGKLYGMTTQGSNGSGVFSINLNGTGYTVLKYFNTSELYGPENGVFLYRGYLYGFLLFGGVEGRGGIFRIRTNGTGYQVLHEFTSIEATFPWAVPSIANNGRIYGTAQSGGTNGYGTLFSIDTSGTGFTVHRNFDYITDGAYPQGPVIQASDGLLYGTTGSSNFVPGGNGTIFRMNLDGTGFTNIKEFNFETEGGAPLWIMDLLASALPVQWTDFTARKKDHTVLLEWQTAQEQNADRFIIERSDNNSAFQTIGSVTAIGNTDIGGKYSFPDQQPLNGDNFYRLKQTDKDGKFSYSKTVRIHVEAVAAITLSPNPALDHLTIKMPASETVKALVITDAAGRVVMRRGQVNAMVITLPVQAFSKGIYWLQIETGQRTYRSSFMKQ